MTALSRRMVIGALAAAAAMPARAELLSSPRPVARPRLPGQDPPPPPGVVAGAPLRDPQADAMALVNRARMQGRVALVLADARSGETLAAIAPERRLPPASVAKALTAAYALDTLGPGHRFETALIATGPLRDGVLQGDLVLSGGGAPGLSSSDLADLAAQAKAAGLRAVEGRFLIWDGMLPAIDEIDPRQPDHLSYNPSVSGLNLNYNRVRLGWARGAEGYRLTLDARAGSVIPEVSSIDVEIARRAQPVYAYTGSKSPSPGPERWTVAEGALGGSGARWLPVRETWAYAGDVFQGLIRSHGVVLAQPQRAPAPPQGAVLGAVIGPPVGAVAAGMLRHSTNLTAEVLGLSATLARTGRRPESLRASAAQMNGWARRDLDMAAPALVDHSGLGDASRVSPRDLARALRTLGPEGMLRPLLREITLANTSASPIGPAEPVVVAAKTGTLNFVSALAGYLQGAGGRQMVFAILTADLDRRAAIRPGDEERPAGARGWSSVSRAMQYDLCRAWSRAG